MKLSTRFRYGVRALVELAQAYPEGPVAARELARRQRVSVKYLQHIMTALRTAGVVRPIRGVNGGYVLTDLPSNIDLSEVFEALEGSPAVVDCVDHPGACPMENACPTRDTWVKLTNAVRATLEGTTLQDLVESREQEDNALAPVDRVGVRGA